VEGTTGFTPYVTSGNNMVIAVSLLLLALGFAFGPAFKGAKEREQASTK
jgi:apolipoprotein N-acyltransferase